MTPINAAQAEMYLNKVEEMNQTEQQNCQDKLITGRTKTLENRFSCKELFD